MSHDRYASAALDIPDKAVAASRNNEVDVLVKVQQGRDFRSRLDGLYVGAWDRSFRKSSLDRF